MTNDQPTALLTWSLYVDCPKCRYTNDLAQPHHDSEDIIAKHVFENNWNRLHGWEVKCENCGHDFKIKEVEY